MGYLKNKVYAMEELKANIRLEIYSILEDEFTRANAHILKRCQKYKDEGG